MTPSQERWVFTISILFAGLAMVLTPLFVFVLKREPHGPEEQFQECVFKTAQYHADPAVCAKLLEKPCSK